MRLFHLIAACLRRIFDWSGDISGKRQSQTEARGGADDLRIVPRDQHCLSRKDISKAALKVLYQLKDAGYESYLVGGGVRDSLAGITPKDFDIATVAEPEQVDAVFGRNCRLIGRRFRLAHVRFGREIIEVATFRAAPSKKQKAGSTDSEGRILRDNVYGDLLDDVWRRDFTCNALYYSVEDFSIRDYVGGVSDIENRIMRIMGNPEARYREDPVRMLRAVRIAAKLGFNIEENTAEPIPRLAPLIAEVPAARLFEECIKLFVCVDVADVFERLEALGLFQEMFPASAPLLADSAKDPSDRALLFRVFEGTRQRLQNDEPVTPAFMYAALLWPAIRARAKQNEERGDNPYPAMQAAIGTVLSKQCERVMIPRRFSTPMAEIIQLQSRLHFTRGKRPHRTAGHPRFRAAYDFFLYRTESGQGDQKLLDWWTDFQKSNPVGQSGNHSGRTPPPHDGSEGTRPARRRRPRRRRRGGSGGAGNASPKN